MNQCSNAIIVPLHSLQKCGLGSFFNIITTDHKLRRRASNGFRHFKVNFSNCLHVDFPIFNIQCSILNKINDYI